MGKRISLLPNGTVIIYSGNNPAPSGNRRLPGGIPVGITLECMAMTLEHVVMTVL